MRLSAAVHIFAISMFLLCSGANPLLLCSRLHLPPSPNVVAPSFAVLRRLGGAGTRLGGSSGESLGGSTSSVVRSYARYPNPTVSPLSPRLLAVSSLALFPSPLSPPSTNRVCLDVCADHGLLAMHLSAVGEGKFEEVKAVDVSPSAAAGAVANLEKLPERLPLPVEVMVGDGLSPFRPAGTADGGETVSSSSPLPPHYTTIIAGVGVLTTLNILSPPSPSLFPSLVLSPTNTRSSNIADLLRSPQLSGYAVTAAALTKEKDRAGKERYYVSVRLDAVRASAAAYECYLLRSAAGASYVGVATDAERRLREHNGEAEGGAKSTRAGRPWAIVGRVGGLRGRSEAQTFEAAVKGGARGLEKRREKLEEVAAGWKGEGRLDVTWYKESGEKEEEEEESLKYVYRALREKLVPGGADLELLEEWSAFHRKWRMAEVDGRLRGKKRARKKVIERMQTEAAHGVKAANGAKGFF